MLRVYEEWNMQSLIISSMMYVIMENAPGYECKLSISQYLLA